MSVIYLFTLDSVSKPTFSYDPANFPLIQPGYPESYERA